MDAGHTYTDAWRDSQLALEMVSPSGCVAWHDHINSGYFNSHCEVPEVLARLAQTAEVVHVSGSTLAVHCPDWSAKWVLSLRRESRAPAA